MTSLDNWLKGHFSKHDGASASPLSPGKKQELQKIMEEEMKRMQTEDIKLTEFPSFCRLVDQCSVQTRPTFALAQGQALILDEFLTKLLDFSMRLAIMNRDAHRMLREDTNLLSTLTSCLNDKYREEDQKKILQYIEVLSRELSLCWTAPYVKGIFERIFAILLSTPPSSEAFLYGLRIVNNMTFHNRNCLNMAARDKNYKDLVKQLLLMIVGGKAGKEVNSLGMHFLLTMDQALIFKMDTMLNNLQETFLNLHLKITDEKAPVEAIHNVVGTIHHMTMCLRSVLTQIFKIWREQPESSQDSDGDKTRKYVVALLDTMTVIFHKFYSKCLVHQRSPNGQVILEYLLRLLVAFCPDNMPDTICDKLWDGFIKALNELSTAARMRTKNHEVVLETHLHLIDRLLKSGTQKIPPESFTIAWTVCILKPSTATEDLNANVLAIRLAHRLNSLACSQKKDSNILQKLLPDEKLFQLLDSMLSEKVNEYQFPDIKLSTCVIEVLNVISKLQKHPTLLMKHLDMDDTWIHIANCIVNGDEELIQQAFSLMGTVGVSAKCRAGVSKTLSDMKDVVSLPKASSFSPEKKPMPSYSAQMGLAKLNHNLEMFADVCQDRSDPAFDDLLSWYTLKVDMYEMELTTMNDHIFHLNRTISHLKSLLNKQSELATKRAQSTTSMQANFDDLKKQLERTNEKKTELETKHAKAINMLKLQLTAQETLCYSQEGKINQIEEQLKEAKENCEQLEASKEEAVQSSLKVTAEKRKLQEKLEEVEKAYKTSRQKVSTLETEHKKSEEARKAVEALLEAERRKTEIIQQVLGNRMN